jgi:hypothetical protein
VGGTHRKSGKLNESSETDQVLKELIMTRRRSRGEAASIHFDITVNHIDVAQGVVGNICERVDRFLAVDLKFKPICRTDKPQLYL